MEEKTYAAQVSPQLSDSKRPIIDAAEPSKRVYQVWRGNNKFCVGGRLIFGPDARSLTSTVSLIVTPVIIFCFFVSPQLIKKFHNGLGQISIAIPLVFTPFILCILFMTSGRDPGIIPRNSHAPEPEEEGDVLGVSADWAANKGNRLSLPASKDVIVNGMVVKVKYCHTCMLYRPPRCSHCSICNNCVDRFDHHCPWVGQSIGKRNYRYFFTFVSSTTLLCLFVFAFCWVNMKKIKDTHSCSLWRAFLHSPVSGMVIMYTFTVSWFVGGLTGFHLYLICTNQTTYESFRYRYGDKMNPHSRGCLHNIKEVLCTSIPPSKNDFRAMVKTPHLSIGPVIPEEFDDIKNQMGQEKCGADPRHTDEGAKGNGEITVDMRALAAEFGTEHGFTDRVNS